MQSPPVEVEELDQAPRVALRRAGTMGVADSGAVETPTAPQAPLRPTDSDLTTPYDRASSNTIPNPAPSQRRFS